MSVSNEFFVGYESGYCDAKAEIEAEAIPKDQYETRLKADMAAMLTELQLEIEELDPSGNEWSDSLDACNDIIQQKINALKENKDGSN